MTNHAFWAVVDHMRVLLEEYDIPRDQLQEMALVAATALPNPPDMTTITQWDMEAIQRAYYTIRMLQ